MPVQLHSYPYKSKIYFKDHRPTMHALLCKQTGCFTSKLLQEFRGETYCPIHLAQNLEEENEILYRNLTETQVRCGSLFLEAQTARSKTREVHVRMTREIRDLEKLLAKKTSELANLGMPLPAWPFAATLFDTST
jgi:hypothetical protein